MTQLEQVTQQWQSQLELLFPDQSAAERASILAWLLGANPEHINELDSQALNLFLSALDYRCGILRTRYLKLSPAKGYERLMRRLASVTLINQKLRSWIGKSRDRHRSVMEVIQEVVQEMLESDRYLQSQCAWLQHCTESPRLRHLLLFASLEGYALRPVRNQPLILCRVLNHLNRSHRGGVTRAPLKEMVYVISDPVTFSEDELDQKGYCHYSDLQAIDLCESKVLEQEIDQQRYRVQQEFEVYLNEELGEVAVKWLRLYLQGYSQESIAAGLGIPLKELYRLREKVGYHAVKIFSVRVQPELVSEWLNISLQDHNFGLTAGEWQEFCQTLTPQQQLILEGLKQGLSLETIASRYHLRRNRVTAEWIRLYLAGQRFRNRPRTSKPDQGTSSG